MVHATLVHHQHDKIGCFSTDLKTPAATGNGDWRWSTPALRRSTSTDPLAVATPEADCNIYHRRGHNDALRIGKNIFRDSFIRCTHDLVENMSRVIEPFSDVRFCF